MSGNKKMRQRDVNKIHRLYREGLDGNTIAKSFNVTGDAIHYVLRHRKPQLGMNHQACIRCTKHVGPNRARILTGKGGAEYRFCPPCHRHIYTAAGYARAKNDYPGIF